MKIIILLTLIICLLSSISKADIFCPGMKTSYDEIKPKFDYLVNSCIDKYKDRSVSEYDEKCELYFVDVSCVSSFPKLTKSELNTMMK